MPFDDTHTDQDFKRRLERANGEWLPHADRRDPDLAVEGLAKSVLSRLLGLFSTKDMQ